MHRADQHATQTIAIDEMAIGAAVTVRAGEIVPVDGVATSRRHA